MIGAKTLNNMSNMAETLQVALAIVATGCASQIIADVVTHTSKTLQQSRVPTRSGVAAQHEF